jgi:D-sedoheptulose 7-phosphate isomerase
LNLRNTGVKPGTAQEYSEETELADPRIYFRRVVEVLEQLPLGAINQVVDRLFQAYRLDQSVYLLGNGGSAALASHAACDLGKGTATPDKRALRAVSLADNVALMTAWANDSSYDDIFAAQLRPLIRPGDTVLAISGSGDSPNVLNALRVARDSGASRIGITGFAGGKMKALCDLCVIVPSENMQQIEDSHVCLMHAVFLALRQRMLMIDLATCGAEQEP